jgi:preprotein translocase subunit SecG
MNSIFVLIVLAVAVVVAVFLSVKDDIEAADLYKAEVDEQED